MTFLLIHVSLDKDDIRHVQPITAINIKCVVRCVNGRNAEYSLNCWWHAPGVRDKQSRIVGLSSGLRNPFKGTIWTRLWRINKHSPSITSYQKILKAPLKDEPPVYILKHSSIIKRGSGYKILSNMDIIHVYKTQQWYRLGYIQSYTTS